MICCYYVVPHADAWLVKFEDGEYGPYRNETDATDFAVSAARQLGTWGERTEVFVLRRGERRIIRKYPEVVAKTSRIARRRLFARTAN
jgi:hypothetical protein